MDLHSAGHRRGVVAAPHALAAEAGRAILAEGGNAIEAMVSMAAAIAAVYPHMNHIGGDGFWLIREPRGRVRALMAPGPAGSKATAQKLRQHILSAGGSRDTAELYVAFRGLLPSAEPLLKQRGFVDAA